MPVYSQLCSEMDLIEKYLPGDKIGVTRNIELERNTLQISYNESYGPDNYIAFFYYSPSMDMRKSEDEILNECVERREFHPTDAFKLISNAPQAPGYLYVCRVKFRCN